LFCDTIITNKVNLIFKVFMKKQSFLFLAILVFGTVKSNDNNDTHLAFSLAQNAAQGLAQNASQVAVVVDRYQNRYEISMISNRYEIWIPNQHYFLRYLYWLAKNNPHFYLLGIFKDDFNYYIAALSDHIKVLEGKIAKGKNGLQSWGMIKCVGFTGLSVLCGYVWKRVKNTKAQQFRNEALIVSVTGAIVCGIGALYYLDKVSRYTARLHERLERDKQLLQLMQTTKVEADKSRMVDAASQLIDIVSSVVSNTLQNQQLAALPAAEAAVLVGNAAVESAIQTIDNEIEGSF
jgi:hypothetical protein